MTSRYEIELSDPSLLHCDCCGGLTVRLTRFVHLDGGSTVAAYFATYANNHPDNEIAMLVMPGRWGEDTEPSERVAFYCRVRPTNDSYEVMLGDAAETGWGKIDIVGAMLSRQEALAHPWKATVFEIVDEAFEQDGVLRGFMHRVHCGDAGVPLEFNFQAPDEIFALGPTKKSRAEVGRSFASLDGKWFFVRCLLPVPVEHYGTWSVGLWVEVAKTDYEHMRKVWDDSRAYSKVRCTGAAANDLFASMDLPLKLGSTVEVHVPAPKEPPRIATPAAGELRRLLSKPWPKAAFEEYAVKRGFL